MMGTLARVLAEKGIMTPKERYWADVEGDIENVNHVLKITQIRVKYNLESGPRENGRDRRGPFLLYHPLSCSTERDRLH